MYQLNLPIFRWASCIYFTTIDWEHFLRPAKCLVFYWPHSYHLVGWLGFFCTYWYNKTISVAPHLAGYRGWTHWVNNNHCLGACRINFFLLYAQWYLVEILLPVGCLFAHLWVICGPRLSPIWGGCVASHTKGVLLCLTSHLVKVCLCNPLQLGWMCCGPY